MKPSRSVPISYVLPSWLRVPVLPIFIGTEIRAIFPAWLLALLLIAVAPLLGEGPAHIAVTLGYVFGCAALGSIAAGHDFMHRTLGMILSLPVSRERLWWTRLCVALAGMTILALLAGAQLHLNRQPRLPSRELNWAVIFFLMPVLSGVFVAPWLTLLCRSALAGAVFTFALPFLFWVLSELIAMARFGFDYGETIEIENFKTGVFGLLLLAHWVAGGVLGRGKFMRLEAIEGRVGELLLPRWLSRRSPAKSVALSPKRGHSIWQLVKKELRLQTMAFATVGLFLLIGFLLWMVHQFRPDLDSAYIDIPTFLYVGLVSLLIGAVASAEERLLGTAEWQALLPMAARTQWAVKVGTVLALVVVLAAFLPAYLVHRVSWGNQFKDGMLPLAIPFAGFATALATMSLYFSSVCNSGLKAMLVSLPAGVGLLALTGRAAEKIHAALRSAEASVGATIWTRLTEWLSLLLLAGLFALALCFAFVNHRSAERGSSRIWRQLGYLIAYAALGTAVFYHLSFIYLASNVSF